MQQRICIYGQNVSDSDENRKAELRVSRLYMTHVGDRDTHTFSKLFLRKSASLPASAYPLPYPIVVHIATVHTIHFYMYCVDIYEVTE